MIFHRESGERHYFYLPLWVTTCSIEYLLIGIIPDITRDSSLYVNTITEMPKPPVESNVIFLKREEIIPAATDLIINFLDRSH